MLYPSVISMFKNWQFIKVWGFHLVSFSGSIKFPDLNRCRVTVEANQIHPFDLVSIPASECLVNCRIPNCRTNPSII